MVLNNKTLLSLRVKLRKRPCHEKNFRYANEQLVEEYLELARIFPEKIDIMGIIGQLVNAMRRSMRLVTVFFLYCEKS